VRTLEAEVTFGKSLLNRCDIQLHQLRVAALNLMIQFIKPVNAMAENASNSEASRLSAQPISRG
jgi:hypothetical protein